MITIQGVLVGLVVALEACCNGVHASVALPKWFGDNMVLQTNAEYGARSFLNGKASPGEKVIVEVSAESSISGGPTYTVVADQEGDWKVQLTPIYSKRPINITVTGSEGINVVRASNVLMGDVFLCSGQSNMKFPLKFAFNATQEIESLNDYPNFRFFATAKDYSDVPLWDFSDNSTSGCNLGSSCNLWITQQEALKLRDDPIPGNPHLRGESSTVPNNYISDFSAVCFMTVRDIARLHNSIGSDRPMGLIQAAYGATRVEAWMSDEAIENTGPKFAPHVPKGLDPPNQKSVLYNAMISPWTHFSIRAVLWYQGERNGLQKIPGVDQTSYYATMYQSMIADWRVKKGIGDFAWGTVQLPPSVPSGTDPSKQMETGFMQIRLAQALTEPHPGGLTDISAVAVTLDLGGSSANGYMHPPNKNEISRRLALGVMHAAYATQEPLWTGPVLADVSQLGSEVFITFSEKSVASGMVLRDVT
jgi:sialate O-acetylesterase